MHSSRGSSWKLWLLIILLIVVIAVLGIFVLKSFLDSTPEQVNNLPTQVKIQDASGKDVSNHLSLFPGTLRPDIAKPDAELILMEISLTGKAADNGPFILTVSNNDFPDNDGLAVYHCANGSWELVNTYLIANHSVSFQVDSLSPFAFEVISSNPEPTATPEPTPTVTPEPTPEPEVVDYGKYNKIQHGEFAQADEMSENGAYVIALVNDPDALTDSAVTFFDPEAEDAQQTEQPITATVLLNYSSKELRTVEVEVKKDTAGKYTLTGDVVDGMLWNVASADTVGGATRFSLVNNENFLNLDEKNENFIMDDNEVRTRWLYEEVKPGDDDDFSAFTTLTYRVDSDAYYASFMGMAPEAVENPDSLEGDVDEAMKFTATKDPKQAKVLMIFALDSIVYELGSDEDLSLDIGADASVTGVTVDGKPLAIDKYSISGGKLTIKASFLTTLDAGNHSISVALADGSTLDFSVAFAKEEKAVQSGIIPLTETPSAHAGLNNNDEDNNPGGDNNNGDDPPAIDPGIDDPPAIDPDDNSGGGDDPGGNPGNATDSNANPGGSESGGNGSSSNATA